MLYTDKFIGENYFLFFYENIKKIFYISTTILLLLTTAYFLRGHIYFYYLTNFILSENDIAKTSIVPTERTINNNIIFNDFKTISNDIFTFNSPWTDIKEIKEAEINAGEMNTTVSFESGNLINFSCYENDIIIIGAYNKDNIKMITKIFDLKNPNDNHEFTEKIYNVSPNNYKFFISKKELTKLAFALPMKAAMLLTESYIYHFNNDRIRGFQYDINDGVHLDVDNKKYICSILIKAESLSQDEIDYIISTIKIKNDLSQ